MKHSRPTVAAQIGVVVIQKYKTICLHNNIFYGEGGGGTVESPKTCQTLGPQINVGPHFFLHLTLLLYAEDGIHIIHPEFPIILILLNPLSNLQSLQ